MEIIVNSEKISSEIYQQEYQRIKMNNQDIQDEKELEKLTQESIIDWTILRQEALKSIPEISKEDIEQAFTQMKKEHGGEEAFYNRYNFTKKDDDKIKEDISIRLKVDRLIQKIGDHVPALTNEVIEKFYEENKNYFIDPEQIHAAHIVKQPNPQNPKAVFDFMMDVRQQLLKGANFKELADQHSSCQDPGGDLGYFARGKMVPEFDTIVFSMNTGEISPVFQTQFGYHIATVYDKKEESQKALNACKDEITNILIDQIKNDKIGVWVDKKKKDVTVEIVADDKDK